MIYAQGEDFSVHFFNDERLWLNCKKCTWYVDLNKLDTLEDIEQELEHHREMCFTWRNHEKGTTDS